MKRRRRRAKRNPNGDHVTYWITLAALVTGAVSVWAYKALGPKARAQVLPGL